MRPVVYLHDIRDSNEGLAGAILGNADLLQDVETYLQKSPGAMLTTDDGYRSITRLLPILERTNTKMLAFLTTGFLDRTVFPYEITVSQMISVLPVFHAFGATFETGQSDAARQAAFKHVHALLKPMAHKNRMQKLAELAEQNNTRPETHQNDVFLSWAEAKELAQHPLVEIGAHGNSHVHLPNASLGAEISELILPRYRLARRLGVDVRALAYPYGGYTRRTIRIARLAGYRAAFSTSSSGTNLLAQPRLSLTDALAECGH